MEKSLSMLLLLILLCILSNGVNGKAKARNYRSEINRRLKLLNKPAVKTIKSEDGDVIACVDIYRQPAFDHPDLKNHTIQMQPSFIPSIETPNGEHENSRPVVSQLWKKRGSCPKGTIPIRRIRRRELLRTNGRKSPESLDRTNKTASQDRFMYLNNTRDSILYPTPENRSTAVLMTYGYNYIGASGEINVWNPRVEKLPEFTTAQIWLKNGEVNNFESVEAGWTVHPAEYSDARTRFFVYWTVDGYKKTGCFDLTCYGFVQTSTEIALGGAVDPGSSSFQQQYVLPINIFMDPTTTNWWLVFHDIYVGYWPGSLFSLLKHSATSVEWGGQVYSVNVRKTPHTKTAMGSGYDAEELYGLACFIGQPRILDYSKSYKYPTFVGIWKDEYNCYSAVNYKAGNANDEATFFFGGPGQSYRCP
ncbi:EARLY FLOWERING family protein [Salix suchowensis]|nr:EARLY FLOWERING family protein [Salix suchowensis]